MQHLKKKKDVTNFVFNNFEINAISSSEYNDSPEEFCYCTSQFYLFCNVCTFQVSVQKEMKDLKEVKGAWEPDRRFSESEILLAQR